MPVNTTPSHAAAAASHSAAGAVAGLRSARPRLASDADDGGGFAAQLMRAQPQPAKADAPESAADKADKADKDDAKDDKDGKPADGTAAAPLFPWASLLPQPAAPTTASLAAGGPATEPGTDVAGGLLAGLKKGARTGKDAAADALAAGKDAKPDAASLAGRSATDVTAALGKADAGQPGRAAAAGRRRDGAGGRHRRLFQRAPGLQDLGRAGRRCRAGAGFAADGPAEPGLRAGAGPADRGLDA
jgi:hypothetical protein